MLTPEDKSAPIPSGAFTVTITQSLGDEAGTSAAPLIHLSEAVTAFSFKEDVEYRDIYFDSDGYYEDDEDDDEDDDEYEELEPEIKFTLYLTFNVNFNVMRELRECFPLPDDTDIVVKLEYKTPSGDLIFYHEFRGFPVIPAALQGTIGDTSLMTKSLHLECESFSLFLTK